MAPEQLERRIADARSDQFAFCVSLWEALDGYPFGDASTAEHTSATTSAQLRREAMTAGVARRRLTGMPPRVRRALVRGLSIDPAFTGAYLRAGTENPKPIAVDFDANRIPREARNLKREDQARLRRWKRNGAGHGGPSITFGLFFHTRRRCNRDAGTRFAGR